MTQHNQIPDNTIKASDLPWYIEPKLYAQPYDISASGFYFNSPDEYLKKSENLTNDYGDPVEEFEIQFIDGEDLDCDLFKALDINQANLHDYYKVCDEWDDDQKIKVIIAIGECSYAFDMTKDDPDDFDIDLYEMDTMRELAECFVDEGLFGDIPENIRFYLDYDAIARDLSVDYTETRINGTNYIYRCS